MTIQIDSTTDSKENIAAANAEPKESKEKAEKDESAPAEKSEQKESPESDTEEKESDGEEKDESEDDADEESVEAKDAKEDKPKKKGGFQRRIDKLNSRYTAAQAEIEHWKKQALKGAGETKADEAVDKPKAAATGDGKPDPDTFDTHAEYVEALTDWKVKQEFSGREQQAAKAKLEDDKKTALKAHYDRVNAFKAKTPDYDDAVEAVDDVPVSPTIGELIVSSENGPELIYELAKNREEFERINKLGPLAMAREIGRLEARLANGSDDKKSEPKKLTNAPKPINPVGSKGGHVEKSIYDPSLSQREYEKLRAKQRAAEA